MNLKKFIGGNLLVVIAIALPLSPARADFAAAVGYNEDGQSYMAVAGYNRDKPSDYKDINKIVRDELKNKGFTVNVNIIMTSTGSKYYTMGRALHESETSYCWGVGSGVTQADADADFANQMRLSNGTKNVRIFERKFFRGLSAGAAGEAQ